MLEYDELNQLLNRAHAAAGASECHGFLCGQICISGYPDPGEWHEYLAIDDKDAENVRRCAEEIYSLVDEMRIRIASADFDFQLLLPDESAPLRDRVDALGGWCHGFLNGVGMSTNIQNASIDEESRELIEDFSKICRVGLDEDKDEADERALVELVEYVRIGAMSLFDSLQPDNSEDDDDEPRMMH